MSEQFALNHDDIIWKNGVLATMDLSVDDQYGILRDHILITRGDKIVAILPNEQVNTTNHSNIIDLKGALVAPGFVDCHTHLVFGGDRAQEWEMRLNGVPYATIAQQGGGINSTVNATRQTSAEDLFLKASKRMQALMNEGVTTIEAKSGYGLSLEQERKQLEVAKKLAETHDINVVSTLLSAHAVPPEYKYRSDEYIAEICQNIMPTLWKEGLFEAVDVFCESVGFTLEQTRTLFEAAKKLGIPIKGHMEQMSNLGGSSLVAEYNGLSVDHIEHLDEEAIKAMAKTRTVAVLLPMAFYFLKDTKVPPIELLRKHHVPMAVSTDFNPGTSPFASIRMAMNMACTKFGLTPAEAFAGATRNGAQALGKENICGQLKTGLKADFAVWDVKAPVEIFYELGQNPLVLRVFNGKASGTK